MAIEIAGLNRLLQRGCTCKLGTQASKVEPRACIRSNPAIPTAPPLSNPAAGALEVGARSCVKFGFVAELARRYTCALCKCQACVVLFLMLGLPSDFIPYALARKNSRQLHPASSARPTGAWPPSATMNSTRSARVSAPPTLFVLELPSCGFTVMISRDAKPSLLIQLLHETHPAQSLLDLQPPKVK